MRDFMEALVKDQISVSVAVAVSVPDQFRFGQSVSMAPKSSMSLYKRGSSILSSSRIAKHL